MFLNIILEKFQNLLKPIYNKSFVLQNIDYLIGLVIILIIFLSTFIQSDYIGYLALSVITLTFIKLLVKPQEKLSMTAGDKFLLLYFIFVLISLFGSTLFSLSLKGFYKTLTYLGFYVSFVHYLKDNRKMVKYILIAIAFSAFGEALVAIKQNFCSVSEISGWQDVSRLNPEEVMTRVYGTLKPYNPNLFGGYMLSVMPATLIAVFLPFKNNNYSITAIGFIVFITTTVALVLTGCRGAYIGLFFELFFLCIFTYKMLKPFYKKIFMIIFSIISTVLFFIIITIPSLKARILSIFAFRGDSSNSFRFNVYNSCIRMFKDNWLLGIGCGNRNFREIYGLYMKTGFDALSAYNIYLEMAVESGIFALLSFLAFLYCYISKAVKYIIKNCNIKSIYSTIAIISIAGVLVHGFVDTVFFRPQIQFIFWIMVGILRVILYK